MKVLAIGTSNSTVSINRTLASHAAGLIADASVEVLDIADYEMPIFSDAREKELGQPRQAREFIHRIREADALVLSFAEHNGSYTAAWKNLFDWASRIEKKVFQDKPALYLSTSPGPGGAASVLKAALESAPFFGAHVVGSVSVPSFHEKYDTKSETFTDPQIQARLEAAAQSLSFAACAAA